MSLIGSFISGLSYAESTAVIEVNMGKSGIHGTVRTRCSRTKKRIERIDRKLTLRVICTTAILCR